MRVFKIMSKNARAFRTTVGISLQQFDFLIRDVEKTYQQAESERLARPDRKRQVGAGRRFSLHLWDRVLLTLMYYRTYLTQDGLTHLFGITQGSISTNIGKMSPGNTGHPSPAAKALQAGLRGHHHRGSERALPGDGLPG